MFNVSPLLVSCISAVGFIAACSSRCLPPTTVVGTRHYAMLFLGFGDCCQYSPLGGVAGRARRTAQVLGMVDITLYKLHLLSPSCYVNTVWSSLALAPFTRSNDVRL